MSVTVDTLIPASYDIIVGNKEMKCIDNNSLDVEMSNVASSTASCPGSQSSASTVTIDEPEYNGYSSKLSMSHSCIGTTTNAGMVEIHVSSVLSSNVSIVEGVCAVARHDSSRDKLVIHLR